MLHRITVLCFSLLYTALSATGEQQEVPVRFQVYLWPDFPGASSASPVRSDTSTDEGLKMEKYTPPQIRYCPTGKDASVEIDAAKNRLSPVYEYTGPDRLLFFEEQTGTDGTIQRIPFGEITLPGNSKDMILLFYPHDSAGTKSKIFAIQDPRKGLNPGYARLYNLSDRTVACLFNRQELLLSPGDSQIATLGPASNFDVLIKIGSQKDDGTWKERYARKLIVKPTDSLICLIYNKPDNHREYRVLLLKDLNQLDSGAPKS